MWVFVYNVDVTLAVYIYNEFLFFDLLKNKVDTITEQERKNVCESSKKNREHNAVLDDKIICTTKKKYRNER